MKSIMSLAFFLSLVLGGIAQLDTRSPKTFITDKCQSDDDCTSGCCSFKRGQCVGPVVAQERAEDGGCGFGDATPNHTAADAFFASQGIQQVQTANGNTLQPVATPAATSDDGTGQTSTLQQQGQQFITGPCNNDDECARKCCNFNTGLCAAPIVAKESGAGCGRGGSAPIFKSS